MLALRIILSLLIIFLIPGYAFTYMLFPERVKIDRLERFSIAVSAGTAISSIVGFGLLKANFNLNPFYFIFSISLISIIFLLIALIRIRLRKDISLEDNFSIKKIKIEINPIWILLVLVLITSIVITSTIIPYNFVHLTEFYISPSWLEESGHIIIKEQVLNVPIEINNLENKSTHYKIKAFFDDLLFWESKDIYLDNNTIYKEVIPLLPYNMTSSHLLIIKLYKNSSETISATLSVSIGQEKTQKQQ